MILGNTQLNGYSLGLPLWKVGVTDNLSTGYIQGISITCRLTSDVNPRVTLAKYSRIGNVLSMVFQLNGVPLCSLETNIPAEPTVFELNSESDAFVNGAVTLIPVTGEVFVNLVNAVVNPKFVHIVRTPVSAGYLKLETSSDTIVSADLSVLQGVTTTSYEAVMGSADLNFSRLEQFTTIASRDTTHIYYINGSRTGSSFILTLSGDQRAETSSECLPYWTVRGNDYCAYVGRSSWIPSCPNGNRLELELNPGNYDGPRPLDVAFSSTSRVSSTTELGCVITSGGSYVLNTDPILSGTIRFNSDYDSANGEPGLRWDDFSQKHDVVES